MCIRDRESTGYRVWDTPESTGYRVWDTPESTGYRVWDTPESTGYRVWEVLVCGIPQKALATECGKCWCVGYPRKHWLQSVGSVGTRDTPESTGYRKPFVVTPLKIAVKVLHYDIIQCAHFHFCITVLK